MKRYLLKTLFILSFLLCLQVAFADASAPADGIELDMPSFSDIKENTIENTKNLKDNIKEKLIKGKEQGKEKIIKAKENAQNAILKAGGKPTDESLSKLTKKEKQDLLLKYQDKGYYGTLPNIEREFDYIKQISRKTNLSDKYKDTLIDEMNLKKTPDNDLFLDVILKKEKDSKYTKDALRMIPILEKFRGCIMEFCGIQKFNANVNLVDLYTRRLEKDYGNTNDATSQSFYMRETLNMKLIFILNICP